MKKVLQGIVPHSFSGSNKVLPFLSHWEAILWPTAQRTLGAHLHRTASGALQGSNLLSTESLRGQYICKGHLAGDLYFKMARQQDT